MRRRKIKYIELDANQYRNWREEGKTDAQIAELFYVSDLTIYRWKKRMGIQPISIARNPIYLKYVSKHTA